MIILKEEKKALIDKVCVYGIEVIDIEDIYTLVKNGIVTINAGQDMYLTTISGEQYSKITIKNESIFDSFTYAIGKNGYVFGRIYISINNFEDYNLNCYTSDEYRQRLRDIQNVLETKYGITTRISEAKFEYMEINKTVEIANVFSEYSRVLNVIFALFPQKLRLKDINTPSTYTDNNGLGQEKEVLTLRRSSGETGIDITVYDKTEQINRRLKKNKRSERVDKHYLRFEIHLKSAQKINKAIGINNVWTVNDKKINAYFNRFIKENVIDQLDKYCSDRDRRIKKVLKEYYIPGSRTWIRDVMFKICRIEIKKRLPMILDIAELLPMLNCLPFNTRQAKYNAKKTFKDICKDTPNIFEGDMKKLEEVIKKLK